MNPLLFLKKRSKRHEKCLHEGISLMGFSRDKSLERWCGGSASTVYILWIALKRRPKRLPLLLFCDTMRGTGFQNPAGQFETILS